MVGPNIPLSGSYLVWKRVSPADVITGGSQQQLSCVLGHFKHGDEQTPECNSTTPNEYNIVWLFLTGLGPIAPIHLCQAPGINVVKVR